jgi:hypothetical protein
MLKQYLMRLAGTRRLGLIVAVAVVAPLALASAAFAEKGEYAVFAHCPTGIEAVEGCLVSQTGSGAITLGKSKEEVPIVAKQTLQGGFGEENEATGAEPFYGAVGAETFSKTPQKVPGGLLGLVKCNEIKGNGLIEKGLRFTCELIFENKTTGVNATTELAAPPTSIFLSEGVLLEELPYPPYPPALSLPVKIKLENTLLGSECYIGSNSEPIELSLTSGATSPPPPNTSIHGKLGEKSSRAKGRILVIKNNTLVGNAFAVGKAHGCGVLGLLDGLIESKIGLPAAAGENTAVLNNTIEQASKNAVQESGE